MVWINAPASRERKLDFQFLTYVSLNICCIKPSAWFPYDLQELTSYIYLIHLPKYMQTEWVHKVNFCDWKTVITFARIDLPISVRNGRHFSANGFVTVRPITMKFVRGKVLKLNFREFHLKLSNFAQWNYRWCSNLIFKKRTFVAFRPHHITG